MNVTTATPAQIDGQIADLNGAIQSAAMTAEQAASTIERITEVEGTYEADYPWNSPETKARAEGDLAAAQAKIEVAREALAPLHAEFNTARGGWTRFYLVANAGGHVHWTTYCGTCFPTTNFAWLTEYSGTTHEEFVEEAGSKACTVCFPDAPVEALNRATRIKHESAEAKAKREEREAKAAAKAAAEVVVADFVNYGGTPLAKTFKTSRAVTNQIASDLSDLCWYGEGHPSADEWKNNVTKCREALAAKGVHYDYDKALAAARKRVTKEGSRPKF